MQISTLRNAVEDEAARSLLSPFLGRPPANVAYATQRGRMLLGKSDRLLADGSLSRFEGKINLIFTSPPFPLNRKKRYGNETGDSYIRWLCEYGPLFKKMLTPDGSIVIEMGNSPPETLAANNQQQLKSLTADDEIGRLEILPDLKVVISLRETSEWEPHVTFVPGAEAGVLHVIINGLHPYYQTLEAKDSINECVQQYIFDAVAEFKASKLVSRVNPDSVRRLKHDLLRARAAQIDNADAEVRAQAEADLFGHKTEHAAGLN